MDRAGQGGAEPLQAGAEHDGLRFEPLDPAVDRLDPCRQGPDERTTGLGAGEVGRVEVTALGVDDDRDPAGRGGGVPREQLQAVEPDERAARRVGEGLGRRQADPQAGIRAGAQADGDEVEVRAVQPGGAKEVAKRRDERPAVPLAGARVGGRDVNATVGRRDRRRGVGGRGVEGEDVRSSDPFRKARVGHRPHAGNETPFAKQGA